MGAESRRRRLSSKRKPARSSPSKAKPKSKPRPAPANKPAARPKPVSRPAAQPAPKAASKKPAPTPAEPAPTIPLRGDGRRHLLSLSFLRDGDEFLARLETDGGQITELKNRSLDQLLTLVAGELEDLLE